MPTNSVLRSVLFILMKSFASQFPGEMLGNLKKPQNLCQFAKILKEGFFEFAPNACQDNVEQTPAYISRLSRKISAQQFRSNSPIQPKFCSFFEKGMTSRKQTNSSGFDPNSKIPSVQHAQVPSASATSIKNF